jgi:hypothetical protein
MRNHIEAEHSREIQAAKLGGVSARFMLVFSLALWLMALAVITFADERPDFTGELIQSDHLNSAPLPLGYWGENEESGIFPRAE